MALTMAGSRIAGRPHHRPRMRGGTVGFLISALIKFIIWYVRLVIWLVMPWP